MAIDPTFKVRGAINDLIKQEAKAGRSAMLTVKPETLIGKIAHTLAISEAEVSVSIEHLVAHGLVQKSVDKRGRWSLSIPRARSKQLPERDLAGIMNVPPNDPDAKFDEIDTGVPDPISPDDLTAEELTALQEMAWAVRMLDE